ncbi:MAG: hypothetical protein AAGO57_00835 [Pseudomonadota bacterium]
MKSKLFICVPEPDDFDPNRSEPTQAEVLRDRIVAAIQPKMDEAEAGTYVGKAKVTGVFGGEDGRVANFTQVGDDPNAEQLVRMALAHSPGQELGVFGVAAVFETDDLMTAEYVAHDTAIKAGFGDQYAVFPWAESAASSEDDAPFKSIEVYYNIDAIPDDYAHPLDFRNAAMDVVESALRDAGEGEWSGAEMGAGEVNFGFDVEDFERAEKIVRAAVQGTPFEGIREITRFSYPDDIIPAH